MLRNSPLSFKYHLLHLFNTSWKIYKLPLEWKIAKIVTIPKPKAKNSFHPISLLSTMGKTMESLVRVRLEWAPHKEAPPARLFSIFWSMTFFESTYPKADDIALAATGKYPQRHLQRRAKTILQRVQTAPSKTEAIYFGQPLNKGISFGHSLIPWSPQVQYLGITLDSQLSFAPHFTNTTAKLGRRINALKVLASKPEGANARILNLVLKACVLTIMEYGAPVL